MLEAFGDRLDVVKLWDRHLHPPARSVIRKVQAYLDHDVIVNRAASGLSSPRDKARRLSFWSVCASWAPMQ